MKLGSITEGLSLSFNNYFRMAVCAILLCLYLSGCSNAPVILEPPKESASDLSAKADLPARSEKVFVLRALTPSEVEAFLAELGLGTCALGTITHQVEATSGTSPQSTEPNAIRITGTLGELARAKKLLDLVDVPVSYAIENLGPTLIARDLPSNTQIAAAMGNARIGTFTNPPEKRDNDRIIIDLHRDRIIAIIPTHRYPDLIRVLRSGAQVTTETMKKDVKDSIESVDTQEAVTFQKIVTTPSSEQTSSIIPSEVNEPNIVASSQPITPDSTESSGPQTDTVSEYSPIENVTGEIKTQSTLETIEFEVGPAEAVNEPDSDSIVRLLESLSIRNADDRLDLALPESLQVGQLLDLTGEYLGLDLIYEPQDIPNETITLKLHGSMQGEVRVRDLYALLQTVLKFKNLAMVPREDRLIAVVPIEDVLETDPTFIDANSDGLGLGDLVVTRIFPLQYVDVDSAKQFLETMKLSVSMSTVEQTQTLFVTCYTHRLARIEQLIRMIDRPGQARVFKLRVLKYTVAAELIDQVKTLASELQDTPIIVSSTSQPRPARRGERGNTAETSVSLKPTVFLDVDERTNRIIEIGPKETIALVDRLIDALDVAVNDLSVLKSYPLQYISADEATAILTQFLTSSSSITTSRRRTRPDPSPVPRPGTSITRASEQSDILHIVALEAVNTLLIKTTQEQHNHIENILNYIDVTAQDPRVLKRYTIVHVDAEQVQRTLLELELFDSVSDNPSLSPSSSRISPAPPRPPLPPGNVEATTRQWAAPHEAHITVLEARNELLVFATPHQHTHLMALLAHMDVAAEDVSIPYEIYYLENQTPEHLSGILTRIIQETFVSPENKVGPPTQNNEEKIVIVPDEQTFSLIVYASKKNQEWISKLIKNLDVRRPQVLIDVTLVEIRKTDEFNYDLDLIAGIPDLVDTSGQIGSFLVDGQTVVEKLQTVSRERFTEFQTSSGVGTGFYGDSHINVLLNLMQSKDYGRILAKPKVLVNDNETGIIKTTETTYVTKTSSIPVSSGGAGQNTTLVETAIDYEGYDAGITMEITPHTSESDLLRLDISLNRSDFGTITGEVPPDRASSELNTVVTVPDASTIILGGMLRLNQSKGGTKVPILGDLPLVGILFRGASNTDIQNKLYIFVRAEIIRPEETLMAVQSALKRTSERNREAFEAHEKEFQNYEILPDVNTPTITPNKVLDME